MSEIHLVIHCNKNNHLDWIITVSVLIPVNEIVEKTSQFYVAYHNSHCMETTP